ncbi:MAG: aminotransferase class V-fold PLP-dependent enzyme [Anaerolineae bacterium]|nr:aminotransferase class V-fold PLP-dependent enzyme [Anaerolineae bacterium]
MNSDLLRAAADAAIRYLDVLDDRDVYPTPDAIAHLSALGGALPEAPTDPADVFRLLDEAGSPGTVASAGSRYYGFVIGGALPAALAANWLAGAWDQNAGLFVASPVGAVIEDIARKWVLDALGFPASAEIGFVTGATMANFTGLAAARHALLQRAGWDVEARGLFGAPPITVVVGDEVHASLLKALSLLGLGRERVVRGPADGQGRMRPDQLPPLNRSTILCIQAGNVNTGAFDPAGALCARAHEAGAWVHVDGAFGMWLAANPERAHLTAGCADADSWSMDAHKWLNVPYDSGLAIVREPLHLRAAMSTSASYLIESDQRDAFQFTPELSRRARGVEIWAALKSLGRSGLAEMLERNCRQAARFADGLREAGYDILNEVVSNQVMVSFGDAETTRQVIAAVQREGTSWCGGTIWHGQTAMRISVSSWATTNQDVEQSLDAILRVAHDIRIKPGA